jgi:hypothetical protein
MAKLLYDYKGFDSPEDKAQINRIVKEKAAMCAKKGLYKELPNILKKEHREVFWKALKITAKEAVFIKGLALLWNGVRTKTKKKISKAFVVLSFSMIAKLFHLDALITSSEVYLFV